MKNLFVFLTISFSVFVVAAPVAFAQVNITEDVCSGQLGNGDVPAICTDIESGKSTGNNPLYGENGILTKAMRILSVVIGIISVIIMIYSGIQIMLTQGDSAKFNKERNQIIYAVVGLVIAASARIIVEFAVKRINLN